MSATFQTRYEPKPATISGATSLRSFIFAGAALTCLSLFSTINCAQKIAAAGSNLAAHPFGQHCPFFVNAFLLAAFAALTFLALAPPETAIQRPARHPSTTQPQPPAYDPLLTLRALACLTVITGHAMGFAFPSPHLVPLIKSGSPAWLLTSAPEAGVWMFFTLSGYLIGKGFVSGRYRLDRNSIATFYSNRILRIVPIYWCTLFMFSLLSIPAIFHLNNLPAFINMLFFNVDGHLPYMPIGALWSISTEIQFYAAAPMLFVLLGKFARRLPLNLIVLLAVMATETGFRVFSFENGGLQNWYARAYAPLITNLDLFLIGMAASRVVLTLRNKNYLIESGLGLGFALFLALYVSMSYLRSQAVLAQSPIAGLLFTGYAPSLTAIVTALVLCGFELAPKYRPGSSIYRFGRPTEIIGTLTYAAYSWHEPVLLFLKHHIRPPATILASLGLFIPALVAILAIAAVLHYLIERPFEIRKKLV